MEWGCITKGRRERMRRSALKWLYDVPGRKKLYILALVATQGTLSGLGVLYALLLRGVVDSAASGSQSGFARYLVLAVLLIVTQLILRAFFRWMNEFARSGIENVFKARITDTILRKDYLRVSSVHSGEWLNRLTNDTVVVANGFTEIPPGIFGMAVKLLGAMIMLIALEPAFAIVLLPCGVVMLLCTWIFRRKLKMLHKRVQEYDGQLRVFLQERISGLLMIRSFAAEEPTQKAAEGKMALHRSARMRKSFFSVVCNIGFGAAMNGIFLFGVGWCGWGILKGSVSFGTLTAVIQLISQIQIPFANITGYLPKYYAMIASAERLMDAEGFEEDDSKVSSIGEMIRFYREELQAIGLQSASFTYYPVSEDTREASKEKMPVVLRNLSFQIQKGEYVAFTGHSGCGKSTALRLLMCVFHPDSGSRYFVDINGTTSALSIEHRRLFAYVPQGNFLMSGTIREIISFASPDSADDSEKLERALEIACASEFVAGLEHGVDTLLGERGAGLSEGQMQRLAVARAVFSESPILLLDEATSALDEATERRLLHNLRSMTEKTVIIVTHRPAALEICDRVLRFTENGLTRCESLQERIGFSSHSDKKIPRDSETI